MKFHLTRTEQKNREIGVKFNLKTDFSVQSDFNKNSDDIRYDDYYNDNDVDNNNIADNKGHINNIDDNNKFDRLITARSWMKILKEDKYIDNYDKTNYVSDNNNNNSNNNGDKNENENTINTFKMKNIKEEIIKNLSKHIQLLAVTNLSNLSLSSILFICPLLSAILSLSTSLSSS